VPVAALVIGGVGILFLLSGCQTATTYTTNPPIGTATTSITNPTLGTGVLEGKVWIGPLPGGPPEKLGLPYPPEIYQPRKVMVYDADHIKLVKPVDITEKGYYSVELPAGKYTVDINYVGTDWSNDVPRKLILQPGIHINADITFNIGPDLYVP
jgi:hypothetical protein